MRRLSLSALLAAGLSVSACGGDKDDGIGPQTNTCTGTCIVVRNISNYTISQVNYSDCSDPSWGVNRLAGGELRPGGSRGWSVTPGCYDIRAYAEEPGASYTAQEFGVQIAQGQTHTLVFDF
jgi:hypothetical protein